MKKAFSLVVAAMLLALLLPLSTASANDSHERGGGNGNKVTVCHAVGQQAVTIRISKNAWAAHKRHGDSLGACAPGPVKPSTPASPTTCTFNAATSAYYAGATSATTPIATGPIRFSWTVASGAVSATGGFWNEMTPVPPATPVTYVFNVTGGSASAAGAVTLSLLRTVPTSQAVTFTGTLAGNVLSGTIAATFFTATGTTTCSGAGAGKGGHGEVEDDD